MNPASYKLGMQCGAVARGLFVPVCLFTAWLCWRSESIGGVSVVTVDSKTVIGVGSSLLLSLLSSYWWSKCGEGLIDFVKLAVLSGPFFVLVTLIDPLGGGPHS